MRHEAPTQTQIPW